MRLLHRALVGLLVLAGLTLTAAGRATGATTVRLDGTDHAAVVADVRPG